MTDCTRRQAILGMLGAGAAFMCRGPLALPEGEVVSYCEYEGGIWGYISNQQDDSWEGTALTEDEFCRALDEVFRYPQDPKCVVVGDRFMELAREKGWIG